METAPITSAPQAWAAPPAPSRLSVSRRGYTLAAVIAVVGLVIGVGGLIRGFGAVSDRVDTFQRVDVPGTGELHFDKPGDFTLYHEAAGISGDDGASRLPSMQVGLEPAQGDTPVTLSEYSGSATYSFGGHEGRAVATFHIDNPGTYLLTSEGDVEAGTAQLAVGGGLGAGLAFVMLPALVLLVALVGAVVLTIVTAIRRYRSRTGHRAGLPPSSFGEAPATS